MRLWLHQICTTTCFNSPLSNNKFTRIKSYGSAITAKLDTHSPEQRSVLNCPLNTQ